MSFGYSKRESCLGSTSGFSAPGATSGRRRSIEGRRVRGATSTVTGGSSGTDVKKLFLTGIYEFFYQVRVFVRRGWKSLPGTSLVRKLLNYGQNSTITLASLNAIKNFYCCYLQMFEISWSVCSWQAFPVQSNVFGKGQELTLAWNT